MPIDSGLKSQILRLSQTVVFESVHNKVFVIATSEPIHEAKSVDCSYGKYIVMESWRVET